MWTVMYVATGVETANACIGLPDQGLLLLESLLLGAEPAGSAAGTPLAKVQHCSINAGMGNFEGGEVVGTAVDVSGKTWWRNEVLWKGYLAGLPEYSPE
ncbi:hypothetical protein HaLaN_31678, partial [Haematococcus lacustris]